MFALMSFFRSDLVLVVHCGLLLCLTLTSHPGPVSRLDFEMERLHSKVDEWQCCIVNVNHSVYLR